MYVRIGVVAAFILSHPLAAQPPDFEDLVEASRVLPSRKCPPRTSADEIVVCGRRQDQYRIPEEFRGLGIPSERSWSAQAMEIMESERTAGQTVGASGASKYMQQLTREWRAERAAVEQEKRALDRALDDQ